MASEQDDRAESRADKIENQLGETELASLLAAVKARGANAVAKELNVPRTSIVAVLARVARRSTETAVACRLVRLGTTVSRAANAA